MKPIIIQGALYSEIDYLIDTIKPKKIEYNNFIFYEGSYNNYPVIISKTKTGEITSSIATVLAITKYNPLFIINQGTAGACNEKINKEDVVIAEDVYYLSQFSMIPLILGKMMGIYQLIMNLYHIKLIGIY